MGNWLSAEPGMSLADIDHNPSGQRDDSRRSGEEAVEKGRNRTAVEGCKSPDFLHSTRLAHAFVKAEYLLKVVFPAIGLSSVKTVADKQRHAVFHNKHW